jgi:predicted NACHT family NTPase
LDRNRKNKKAIPVYITLAAFDKEEQRIEEEIARKTDRSVEFVENYLKEGKFAVFIDGFNELMDKISTKFERSIQIFIDRYQNTKTVIASRPTAYENIAFKQAGNADLQSRKPIRAFLIKEMKDDMIEQFVKKNYTKPEDAKNLLAKIRENKKLEQMLGNPLYLFELIQIYDPEKQIPPSTNALTGKFLESKYKREKSRNTEFKRDIFHETMILYAQTVYLEIGEDNPHVAQETAWKIVTKELAEHKISVKTFFEWALSLHILFKEKEKSEKEKYFFTHQSYFSYYYSIEQ